MNDQQLRHVVKPISQYCHDWMPGTCSSGTMTVCIWALLSCLSKQMPVWTLLAGWVGCWVLPYAFCTQSLADLFDAKRVESYRKAKKFKCTASECLAIYPIISHFVQKIVVPQGLCLPQRKAFLAMADVVDVLHSVANGCVTPELLLSSVETALSLFVSAGWNIFMIKKFHRLLHMSNLFSRYGMLPACWTLERKHKLINTYANPVCNTLTFEQSILEEALSHDLAVLREPKIFDLSVGLVVPHKASMKLRSLAFEALGVDVNDQTDCMTSSKARVSPSGFCCKGDYVLLKHDASNSFDIGEVWLHLEVKGVVYTLISMCNLLHHDKELHVVYAQWQDAPALVSTQSILCCLTWSKETDDKVMALIPLQYRT